MTKQQVIQYLDRFQKDYAAACENQERETASFQEWCAEIADQVASSRGNEDDAIAIAEAGILDLQANMLA